MPQAQAEWGMGHRVIPNQALPPDSAVPLPPGGLDTEVAGEDEKEPG